MRLFSDNDFRVSDIIYVVSENIVGISSMLLLPCICS